jgi:hypothetical protein
VPGATGCARGGWGPSYAPVVPSQSAWRGLLELFALCGLAVTQPVLEVFGRSPDQFALRSASAPQIVAFAVGVALLPTLGLWAIELVVGIASAKARAIVHTAFVGGLIAVVAVQVLHWSLPAAPVYVLAALLGAAGAYAYRRFAAVRTWLAFLAIAPFGFVFLFLFASPTAALLDAEPAAAGVEVPNPAPVVVIVLDELPLSSLVDADRAVDPELYPNLAALADTSHWFRNATSVSPSTWHAVPAIQTGNMPEDGEGPSLSDHPENLFTLLDGTYSLNVVESVTRLCPTDSCPGGSTSQVLRSLSRDVRAVLYSRLLPDEEIEDPVEIRAVDPRTSVDTFIDGLSGEPGSLSFLHLLMPHVPYQYLDDGTRYAGPRPDLGRIGSEDRWDDQEWPTVLARQRLILQMMYTDEIIGEVVDRLRSLDAFDESLIVVTSDHGIAFEPDGGIRYYEGQPIDATDPPDVLWVPLIVKEPGQREGVVNDDNVLAIDVLPTIADVLGVELPWAVDGRSALGPPRAGVAKPWRGAAVSGWGIAVGDEVIIDGTTAGPLVREPSVDLFLPAVGSPDRVWRVGPSPALFGARVLDAGERLDPLDLELISGPAGAGASSASPLIRASGDGLRAGDPVAVAIDGRVVATGLAFDRHDGVEVAMMVSRDRMSADPSAFAFYRIRSPDG